MPFCCLFLLAQGVWSEDDSCIASLSVDLDNIISPQLPLHTVLERVATCLGKAQRGENGSSNGGGSGRGEGEGEEESDMDDGDDDDDDDDDDGYYGDDIDAMAMDDEPSHSRYH